MEAPVVYYNPKDVIETTQGNKVSKSCKVHGSQNIMVNGSSILCKSVIVRGDLSMIRIGKYCVIQENVILRPSYKQFPNQATYVGTQIGDYVMIEENAVIEAVQIGAYVRIGKGAVIGNGCIIKDCSIIMPGAVVPPDTMVAPFSVYAGNPAQRVDDASEATQTMMTTYMTAYYSNYKASSTT